jgi:hypothetical protein
MHLPIEDFRRNTGLCIDNTVPRKTVEVTCLKDMTVIEKVIPMTSDYLERMVSTVTYGLPEVLGLAYRNCQIEVKQLDPRELRISQSFVQRDKASFFREEFVDKFSPYMPSLSMVQECGPFIAIGQRADGQPVMAHYLPPIVEEHGDKLLLLEGGHRQYVALEQESTHLTVVIRDVRAPFPWETAPWLKLRVVDVKPHQDDRHFGKPAKQYFRHFLPVGLDT